MQVSFIATVVAVVLYVVISLLTCREDFNLDRLLHRGRYAAIKAVVGDAPAPVVARGARARELWQRVIGIDEHFTKGDRFLATALFGWSIVWFLVAVIGTIWNLTSPWPLGHWSVFWQIAGIGIPVAFSLITAVWFTWGGLRDMRDLFRRLREEKVNHLDDGSVVDGHNLDEAVLTGPAPAPAEVKS